MREIKFRGCGAYTWYYGLLTEFKPDCGLAIINCCEVDPSSVGQFTGLTDSKGNEIYEGDVIFNSRNRYVVAYKTEWASYVAYQLDSLGRPNKEKAILLHEFVNMPVDRLKPIVVGNVYDSPELIEDSPKRKHDADNTTAGTADGDHKLPLETEDES